MVVIFPQARIEVNQLIDLRLVFSYRYRLLPGVIMGGGFLTFSINYFWFFIVQRALRRRDKNRLKCKVEKVFFIFNSTETFHFFGSEISAVCCTFVPFCIYHVHVKKKLLSILRKQSWPINIPTHLSEIVHGHNFVATPEKPSRQPWFDRSGSGLARGKFFITPFPFAFYARQNCMQSVGEQSSA